MTEREDEGGGASKSQRKREAHALQELAVSLVDLPAEQLARLPLPGKLREAVAECRRITSRGALRRQRQYLGRLMRGADADAIREALAALEREAAGRTRHFHELEHWRDRLLAEGDSALDALLAAHPRLQRAPIRSFLEKARREAEAGHPPRAARALFRHLREHIEAPAEAAQRGEAPVAGGPGEDAAPGDSTPRDG